MLNVGGGKMTMKCNQKGCPASVSFTIIKGKPGATAEMLMQEARNEYWDDKKHLCPDHK